MLSIPTYMDFFPRERSFLSLDISVNSTGYVLHRDGAISYGTLSLPEGTPASRRLYFRNFLLSVLGVSQWDAVYVEDVFGGSNFQTVRTLVELNCIVDDLREQGLIRVSEIVRLDNGTWKKRLRRLSNYVAKVKGADDKTVIRECLGLLSFSPVEGTPQDVYDALGIAIAGSYPEQEVVQKKSVVSFDLMKGYKIRFCSSFEAAEKNMKRYPVRATWVQGSAPVFSLDFTAESFDLATCFTRSMQGRSDNHYLFVMACRLSQLGALGIKFGASFPDLKQSDVIWVLAYPTK